MARIYGAEEPRGPRSDYDKIVLFTALLALSFGHHTGAVAWNVAKAVIRTFTRAFIELCHLDLSITTRSGSIEKLDEPVFWIVLARTS